MIDFVALDYNHSTQYTYCYKLEGFDNDWNCIGTNHGATYTNIDPGHYTFLVKAANREGVWSESPLRLEITIDEVFWKNVVGGLYLHCDHRSCHLCLDENED